VTAANGAMVFFELAGETNIAPGDLDLEFDLGVTTEFSLDVYMQIGDDEDGADGLFGGMFTIYVNDPNLVSINGGTVNTELWDLGYSSVDVVSAGETNVQIFDYNDKSQPYGDLLLATVTFTLAGEAGTANLTMDFLSPGTNDNFVTWSREVMDDRIEFGGATVTVNPATDSPAPLPGVLLLLLLD
jgi:hypothetical protein